MDLRCYPVDAVVTEYDGLGELEVGSPGRGVEVVMVLVMAVLRNTTVSTRAGALVSSAPVLHLLDPDAAHARVPAIIPGRHTVHRRAAAVCHLQTSAASTSYSSS